MAKKKKNDLGESGTTVFHLVEDYLSERYDLRFNEVSLNIEISLKNENEWKICNESTLFVELRKKGINISIGNLTAILRSDYVPYYNPLKSYFENLTKWRGNKDYIKDFADYVKLAPGEDKEQFIYHFKKWCARTVKCSLLDGYFNKQALILSDDGKGQNIGKSTWCRYLCPPGLKEYIAEEMSGSDKDTRLLLCKNFIINLDELAGLNKKDINQLKSLLSKDQVNERLPYDRKNSVLQRCASFVGSTNESTFLMDDTGSVRWLCFMVDNIDFNYKDNFDINLLWSQAYYLAFSPDFDESMTRQDVIGNELRNKKFQVRTPEHELLLTYIAKPQNNTGEWATATDILNIVQVQSLTKINMRPVNMGKALNQEGFEKKKSKGHTFYLIEIRKK